ncbi:undecaprenyl-phosphate glucose phosphotransferase [Enterovibrio norvegicus]|uniref:Undecaprenyl-phosphate glucose phosphotransferase n=2 Tax=Enterovibrio norvegicus TaxID=188144 RepID=A0ABV4L079_9GAMM|nr:undecaprenyl-phosphate glucose phosphotransferase [Enterovibrio norvegicus]OEF52712.1 undecaprenyl-phosphate glucose phosphotransferase [Enterovibrio norvegicus]OEF57715.1 undecaprenyl-phosphate glucose phosphotransferase [Enterovibrio norvegicus]SFP52570.1 putative colanic acid biosysnthesis UDP-glucose lipid carrier transferase [Enterovibrio norvegicus DSM 15893]
MDSRKIRTHGTEFAILYRICDLAVIGGTLAISSWLYLGQLYKDYLLIVTLTAVCFLLFAESAHLYRSWRVSNFQGQMVATLLPWFGASAVLVTYFFFTQSGIEYSRAVMMLWFLLGSISLVLWRYSARMALSHLRNSGINTRRAAIIGTTANGIDLAREFQRNHALGIKLTGFYEDRGADRIEGSLPAPMLGKVDDALEQAKRGELQHVYIAMPMHAKDRIARYLNLFADTTATTYLVPDFFTYNLLHSRWQTVGHVHTLSVHDTPFNGLAAWTKRMEDIVLSILILLLISPVMLFVAAGVKLSSPGPIIFKQSRYGLDGRKIDVWKFRSMSVMDNGDDVKQATKNDPRVTRFGAFIRRTSLDELPQFFNVLQGSMSIVGPRPHAVAHNEQYRAIVDRYMLRHKVKPGITGWAQINGYRGETDTLDKMEKRIQFDLEYIQNWSLWMDIKIVFATVFKGFVGKTAY